MGSRLDEWLAILRTQGGSDLCLVAGLAPSIRVITRRDGSLAFEESLAQLVSRGLLAVEDARAPHRDIGGKSLMRMADLREMFIAAGWGNVRTCI